MPLSFQDKIKPVTNTPTTNSSLSFSDKIKPVITDNQQSTPQQPSITETTIGSIPVLKQLNEFGIGIGTNIAKAGIGLGQTFLKGANVISGVMGAGKDQYNPAIDILEKAKQDIYTKPFQSELSTGFGKTGEVVGSAIPFVATGGAITSSQQFAKGATQKLVTDLAKQQGIKKVLGYFIKTGANILPEVAISGATQYGVSGGDTESAKNVAIGAGVLSGITHVGSDIFNSVIPQTAKESAAKAFGITGKMTLKDAASGKTVNDSVGALTTINNLAPEIKVFDANGIEKTFEPTKATITELPQALYQAKNKIYQTYTDLAKEAGDTGAYFGQGEFNQVVSELNKYSGKGYTPAYSDKAKQIMEAIFRYGKVNPKDGAIYFPNVNPVEIQTLIENINKDVNPLSDSAGAIVAQDASQIIRKIMDEKITSATGGQYQALRDAYSQLKTVEQPIINLYKKALRSQGTSFSNDLINGIASVDAIQGLLTRSPESAIRGGTTYVIKKIIQYSRDPEVNIQRAFKQLRQSAGESVSSSGVGARLLKTPTDTEAFKAGEQKVKELAATNKQAGFVSIGGKTFKEIPEATKAEMVKAIDYLRNGKVTPNIEDTVSRLAQKYNISEDLSNAKIANLFEDLIDKTKTKSNLVSVDPLLQEAKKYKSAESFAMDAGSIKDNYDWAYLDEMKSRKKAGYAVSQSDYNYLSKIEKQLRGKESKTFYRAGEINKDGDIWLTPQQAGAEQYANAGGTKVGKYKVLVKNPLILNDLKDIENVLGRKLDSNSYFANNPDLKDAVIKYAKDNGYDSAMFPDSFPDGGSGMESLVVWDKNLIKTKSQLIDIWNKANAGNKVDPLIAEAKKYKSAEEFVNKKILKPIRGTANDYGETPTYKALQKSWDNKESSIIMPKGSKVFRGGQDGVYYSADLGTAESYAGSNPVVGVDISGKKLGNFQKFTNGKYASDPNVDLVSTLKKAMDEGYDGLYSKDNYGEVILPTKSQLIDIWNKAHGKANKK